MYKAFSRDDDRFWKKPLRRAVENGTIYKTVSIKQYEQVRSMMGKPITHGTRYLLLMRGYHLRIRQEGRVPILDWVTHSTLEEVSDG